MKPYIEKAREHMQLAMDALREGIEANNIKDKTVEQLLIENDPDEVVTAFHIALTLGLLIEEM